MRWLVSTFLACFALFTLPVLSATVDTIAGNIAPLIEPAKLATLGTRGANPRVQKYVYWLALAKQEKHDPAKVASAALQMAGYTGKALEITQNTMTRNVVIAERLGALDGEGMAEMRKGNAATVKKGAYRGDQLSVDHIIPRSVVLELDNVIANLELMPSRANSKKKAKIGKRQRDVAAKLFSAGLLSAEGLGRVQGTR